MQRCLRCERLFTAADWACPHCGFAPVFINGYPAFAPADAHANNMYLAEYFARLQHIEPGHFWFEARNQLIISSLRRYFPGAQSFIEIGCGTGFVLAAVRQHFPALRLAATDLMIEALDFAQMRVPDAELAQMDARHIPYQAAFDVIGSFDVLEHIEEDARVLAQMFNAVKPGGGLLVTVPQHPWLWSVYDDHALHKRRYTRAELVRKAEAAGFEVLRVTSFISMLLPLMFASRWRHRRPDEPLADGLAHLAIAAPLNTLFKLALRAEARLLDLASLPAGGSLLLVARRPQEH